MGDRKLQLGGKGGPIVYESELDSLVGRRISIDMLSGHYHDITDSSKPLRRITPESQAGEAAQGRVSSTPIPSGRLRGYRELELEKRWAIEGGGSPPLASLPMKAIDRIVAICQHEDSRYEGLIEHDDDHMQVLTVGPELPALEIDRVADCVDCREPYTWETLNVDSRCPGCAEVAHARARPTKTIWEKMWEAFERLLSPLWR